MALIQIDIRRSQMQSWAASRTDSHYRDQIYGLSTKLSDFVNFDCAMLTHAHPNLCTAHPAAVIWFMQYVNFKLLPPQFGVPKLMET